MGKQGKGGGAGERRSGGEERQGSGWGAGEVGGGEEEGKSGGGEAREERGKGGEVGVEERGREKGKEGEREERGQEDGEPWCNLFSQCSLHVFPLQSRTETCLHSSIAPRKVKW